MNPKKSSTKDNSAVTAYEGNCNIKRDLGESFSLTEFITEDKIKACDALIHQAAEDFFTDAEPDLEKLEALLTESFDFSNTRATSSLETYVYNIRCLAKVLGFTLITEICIHLINATRTDSFSPEKKSALLRKLVETLRLAFDSRIQDDGGEVGKKILKNLRARLT